MRSHGGRYLNLDKNNKLNIDTNVDLNRSSEDLERCGSTFKLNDLQKLIHGDNQGSELLNDQGQQVSIEEQGKEYTVYIEKFGDEHQVRNRRLDCFDMLERHRHGSHISYANASNIVGLESVRGWKSKVRDSRIAGPSLRK